MCCWSICDSVYLPEANQRVTVNADTMNEVDYQSAKENVNE